MSKTSIEPVRHSLFGPTMGTRWTALFFADSRRDVGPVRVALQEAVEAVDRQMSTWNADSDLMRLNAAPKQQWIAVPELLMKVLRLGLDIGRESGGAFDIAMGDAVTAWGFGPATADAELIRAAMNPLRRPAYESVQIDEASGRVLKRTDLTFDFNGIAKGFGVDRLAEVLAAFGIGNGLVGIDGELRALGVRPDGKPWSIAVESPETGRRAPHAVLALEDAAVATSGDYRQFVDVDGRRLSHTMNPGRGAPLAASPASVTVVARTSAEADAWATAMMVLGEKRGRALAEERGMNVLFLMREEQGAVGEIGVGSLFGEAPKPRQSLAEARVTRAASPAKSIEMPLSESPTEPPGEMRWIVRRCVSGIPA